MLKIKTAQELRTTVIDCSWISEPVNIFSPATHTGADLFADASVDYGHPGGVHTATMAQL